ncbi:lipoate--protein ligase family protein [Dolosicoccus paucivorans]
MDLQQFFTQRQWLIFDNRVSPHHLDNFSSLVYQDSFIRYVQDIQPATSQIGLIHLYPTASPTILLGARDTRLPKAQEGFQLLKEAGYQLIVRPHGGLAVVTDPGVVNLSFVVDTTHESISIDQGYEAMAYLIQSILAPYGAVIETYETPDSYCPGKYDLVLNGKKIGGIAQRRFKQGITVAAYLSLDGNQDKRATLIREFYQVGQADDSYPQVNPQSMTTLEKELNRPYDLNQFVEDLSHWLQTTQRVQIGDFTTPEVESYYQRFYPQTTKRSQRIEQED